MLGSLGLSRMACCWAAIPSSIGPMKILHLPIAANASTQFRLTASAASYSGMASAHRRRARSTCALAKCASALLGDAATAFAAKSSARWMLASSELLSKSSARPASVIANRLCASTNCGSSANARSKKSIASLGGTRLGFQQYRTPPENVVERVGMLGGPRSLSSDQLYIERYRDPARDLVLQSEQIGHVAVESLSPQMSIGFGVDQLRIDADLVARPPDAAFEYEAHPQLATDLLGVDPLALIGERGIS